MAPKRSASSNQSIATSFRPTAKKAGSAQQQQQQKQGALNRSSSLQKPVAAPTSRSQSPEKRTSAINDLSTLSKAEVDEAQTLPELDVDSREWEGIWKTTQREKLGKVGPIHSEGLNRVHHILRCFDFDPAYGPNLGMTRLERWNRAKNLGEDPPLEVYEILTTKQGRLASEYRESCLAGQGL
ncbi:unnamed protein product [Jaminaea pallidilutea]